MEEFMYINEYQDLALKTAIYGIGVKINYPILGLVGEAGELANKYKKKDLYRLLQISHIGLPIHFNSNHSLLTRMFNFTKSKNIKL